MFFNKKKSTQLERENYGNSPINNISKLVGSEKKKLQKNKIKILFGITLPEMGGAQKVVYDIINSLSKDKYEITLVTSPGKGLIDWVNMLNDNGRSKVNIITLPCIKREISPLNDMKAFIKLYFIMKKGKFQIAHFHSSKMGILGRFAAWFARVPKIFFTVHGWGINESQSCLKRRIFSLLEMISGKLCTKIICVSKYDRDKGIRNNWIDENKACLIRNGVSTGFSSKGKLRNELNIDENIPIIGTITRLREPKDPIFTINVFAEIKSRGYNTKLIIIGDGPLIEKCAVHAYELGLNRDVFLIGSRDDARELLCDFDIFTLFSKWEGLPLSIIEAMFSQKPVIASNVGGVPELIHNDLNGYLVDGEDITKAADFIETLLKNVEARNKMGLLSKQLANKYFSKEKMLSQYEILYLLSIKNIDTKKKIIKKMLFLKKTNSKKKNINKFAALVSYFSCFKNIKIKTKNINKPISLGMNFSWVFTGNFIYAASRGCILILLTKLGSVQMVGEFGLAFAITAPIFMMMDLKLRSIIVTDINEQYHFNHYLGLRLLTSLFALAVVVMVILICGYKGEIAAIILLVALAKGFESISDIIFGLFQKLEVMGNIGKSLCAKGILSALLTGFLVWLTGSLVMGIAGLAVAWFLLLIMYDLVNARKYVSVYPSFKLSFVWPLIRLSLPLGAVTGLATLNANIPGYFIQGYLGSESLGYYTSILYLIVASETIINSLGQSMSPRLVKYYATGNKKAFLKELFKLVTMVVCIGVSGLMLVAGFGRNILAVLYTTEYVDHFNVFILLMIASCTGYISIIINYAITAARIFKIQPFLFCATFIINLVFNFILVPEKGLDGVVYASIISSYLLLFLNLIVIYKLFLTNNARYSL